MNTLQIKIVIIVLIAIVIYVSGAWLNKSGKPYNVIVLTIHKLIAFGIFIYIVISCYRIYKTDALTSIESILCLFMVASFLSGIISGGFLSANASVPSFVQLIHRVSSVASVIFTGAIIYLLRVRL